MTRAASALLILAATVSGCARYESQPLDRAGGDSFDREPDHESLRVAASELHHPILKPLQIDWSRGVSPDEVAVLAVILNPDLRAERDRRAVSRAQLMQAGLLPNPQLSASVELPYNSSAPDDHTAYGLGLAWDLNALIARGVNVRAADEQSRSVELELAWKEWQTAQAAKTSAYNIVALEHGLAIAQEIEQQLNESLQVIQKAVDAHEKTFLELSAAMSLARDARVAVIAQERELRRERLTLNQALGLPPETTLALRKEDLPRRLAAPTVSQLVTEMDNRRLDLVALRHGYQSQEAAVRAAILGQFPRISAGPTLARDTADVKSIGIGLAIDLPIFDRNQAAIALEKATRQKLFDEYTSRRMAARAEIAMAVQEIQSISEQIAAVDTTVSSLQELLKTYQSAVEQGNADIVSFYAARGDLATKRLDANRLQQELVQQWIALELASGQFLRLDQQAGAAATQPAGGEMVR